MTARKQSSAGRLRFSKKGIYLKANGASRRVADPIRVIAFGSTRSSAGEASASTVIRFLDRRGAWKRKILPSATLTSPHEFIVTLASAGYMWPAATKLRARIVAALSMKRPERDVTVVEVPGHHEEFFVLPDESYGPGGPERTKFMLVHKSTVKLGEFRRSGTLEEWKRHIGLGACIHSSRARLAIAASFAAPNLRLLNINSFGINFSGSSSRGKTLLIRLGLSAVGLNRQEGPETWDGSETAFEQRALGHRDCIMPLDELSHLADGNIAKVLTMRLAGNRPKAKAGQYVLANEVVDIDWRVIAISTSEDPIWGTGRRDRVRGEQVRMIDVPACVSRMEDVFDGPGAGKVVGATLEQRIRYVERQERLTLDYQGEAFRTYLTKRSKDKFLQKRLNEFISEFVDAAPLQRQFPWLGRIRRFFAIIYASAALAIEYDVLPWGRKKTLTAIKNCMDDAVEQMVEKLGSGPAAEVASTKTDDARLQDFRKLMAGAEFVRINPRRRVGKIRRGTLKRANGIIRPTSPGKIEYLLFSDVFDRWCPDVSRRRRLKSMLQSRRIIGKGRRPDTSTRQVYISELGRKVPCYRISRKRLLSS
jgi:hypothetical protein